MAPSPSIVFDKPRSSKKTSTKFGAAARAKGTLISNEERLKQQQSFSKVFEKSAVFNRMLASNVCSFSFSFFFVGEKADVVFWG